MKTLIFWLLVVFVLSVYPFKPANSAVPHADKALHFVIYAVTAVLFFVVMVQSRRAFFTARRIRTVALAAVLALGYGLLMETAQKMFTATREFSAWDIAANALGAAAGAAYVLIMKPVRGRR